jgi:thiamine biosynthesis protein ThiI
MSNTEGKTFKVITNRSDKTYEIHSMDMNDKIGGHILRNTSFKVDVHNPDVSLNVEIRRDYVYVYNEGVNGLGGYPVGTLGRALLMLSGGIDSPVAGYQTIKRGVELYYLYFESRPHTSIEARNKVIELSKKLLEYTNSINLYVVPFTEIQEAIYASVDHEYTITIMRRMMYRIMEKLVKKYHAHVIINGESIGQVASQTLVSMNVINSVTNLPVIRPVACMDKLEIIDISERIGTYETSILPYEDCCTIFLPKHPVINPDINHAIEFENRFNYQELIDKCVENIETIELNSKNKFEEYL